MAALGRVGHSIVALLRALDLLVCTIWLSCLYPFGLADKPTGRHMISSYVGKAAHNGHSWGKRAARVIDWGAMRLGDAPEHCHRAYLFYSRLETP
jgi:hypothetical protein